MFDFFRPRDIIRCTCAHVPMTEVQLTNIFKRCDLNGDGYLTKEDLTEAFRQLGSTFPGYRAARALHRADKNGDGMIDKKELNQLVEYARKRGYRLKNACSNK
ncbi:hypothetical protein P3S67_011735 [Capsicum chacoense]|uniref:EF-hand domain-containing protein n=1 Tax=Capsicum annuum TaxID=4072 RepID=A0A2G2ZRM2_CAPAN|nr:putative BRI1 kinase inhibitor 1 [Capsicum annuum]PHT84640.1 hypothetical protein T459_13083 [Capsicum annuum]